MKPVFIFLLCIAATFNLHAQRVYVATTGTDGAGFGTATAPYKTIQYAHDNAQPGDSIMVSPGTYSVTTPIVITKAITITNSGGLVELDASAWDTTIMGKHMLTIHDVNNVTVNGISITNCIGSGSKGIYLYGVCKDVTIRSCAFRNISWSKGAGINPPTDQAKHNAHVIHVVGDGAQPVSQLNIKGCELTSNYTGFSEGVTLTGYIDSFYVTGNKIQGNDNIGIVIAGNYAPPTYIGNSNPAVNQPRNGWIHHNDVQWCVSPISASAGIYIDGAYNCFVEYNWLLQNGVGVSVGGEQSIGVGAHALSGNVVRGNIVISSAISGMVLGANNASVTVQNVLVCNNTLYKNRAGSPVNVVDNTGGEIHLQNVDGLQLQNNIIHALDTIHNVVALDGYTIKNFNSDYNLYYRDDGSMSFLVNNGVLGFNNSTTSGGYYAITPYGFHQNIANLGLDTHSYQSAPLYGGLTQFGYDFMPDHSSQAIDNGNPDTALIPPGATDQRGIDRIFNKRVDMGAYEWQNYIGVNEAYNISVHAILYPNPSDGALHLQLSLLQPVNAVVIMTDITGKTIYRTEPVLYAAGNQEIALHADKLVPGNYIVSVYGNHGEMLWSGKLLRK